MRAIIKICPLVLLALTACLSLQAGPLKDPRRVVNGQTVDLSPLFRWWTNHDGGRPLTAWVRVTGALIGTNSWGWTLNAGLDAASSSTQAAASTRQPAAGQVKIILKNPPIYEQAQFDALTAQLKVLTEEHARISKQETQDSDKMRSLTAEKNANHHLIHSRALAQESKSLKMDEAKAKDQLKPIDAQLQECRAKLAAYPDSAKYSVDCFALDTGQTINGAAVYDHGAVFK